MEKKYFMFWTDVEHYKRFILGLGKNIFFNYSSELEKELIKENFTGMILVDELLAKGNTENRFLQCEVENGKILSQTARNVVPISYFSKKTSLFLFGKDDVIKNSALSEEDKNKLRNHVML